MNQRRHDLDWLRIVAFGLLILYHVGMFYVTWDWHVKSSRAGPAIEPLMRLVNPWRLTLLFLIAGAATRFMADKMSASALARSRMYRLWPPLLLAIFVIVPPQSYYEVVEALRQMPSGPAHELWLQDFYLKYVTATGHWCDSDGCLITPTYNHMWFVAYLIIYTLALILLLPLLRRIPPSAALLISGPGLIVVPWSVMFLLRLTLVPLFGETHYFWNDWYLHPLYFLMFVFGFSIAKHSAFFEHCTRLRWLAALLSLLAWAASVTYPWPGLEDKPVGAVLVVLRALRELQAWTAIVAMLGFAHRYLRNADGPVKRLLTQAIFPFYLIHQTIIVVAAHHLDALGLPLAFEVPLLIGITALGCWLFFDLLRRIPAAHVWIGLGPDAEGRDKTPPPACEDLAQR